MTTEKSTQSDHGRSDAVRRTLVVTGSAEGEGTQARPDLPAAEMDSSIPEFVERILATNERVVPVRKNGEVVGTVSVTDVVRAIARRVITVDAAVANVSSTVVETVYAGTPLPTAARQLSTGSGSSAIVLNEDGSAVGILTGDDLVDAARFSQGKTTPAPAPATGTEERVRDGIDTESERGSSIPTLNVELPAVPVTDVSTDDVPTVTLEQCVTDAAQVMISREVEQVAVQWNDQLVGVVRDRDLLHALVDRRRDD